MYIRTLEFHHIYTLLFRSCDQLGIHDVNAQHKSWAAALYLATWEGFLVSPVYACSPKQSSLDILVRGGHSGSDYKQSSDHDNHVFTSFPSKGHFVIHRKCTYMNNNTIIVNHIHTYVYTAGSCARAVGKNSGVCHASVTCCNTNVHMYVYTADCTHLCVFQTGQTLLVDLCWTKRSMSALKFVD